MPAKKKSTNEVTNSTRTLPRPLPILPTTEPATGLNAFCVSKDDLFINQLIQKMRRHPKRIVFPEGEDERVLRVARELVRLQACAPILLGNPKIIKEKATALGLNLEFIRLINPSQSPELPLFAERLRRIERFRQHNISQPHKIVSKPHNFAAMMVQYSQADGLVGGTSIYPATFFRSLISMIKPLPGHDTISSCTVHHYPDKSQIGHQGTLVLGDCGVIPEPTEKQLARIAVECSKLARLLFSQKPRVAMLSFSTKGSANTTSTRKIIAATALARQLAAEELINVEIDGELQPGAALIPSIAQRKAPDSTTAGRANVLIFPNLESGHISARLLEHVGGARAYGQIILGLCSPAAHVSRVSNESSIFGAALLVGLHAIRYHELYPEGLND